MKKTKHIYIAHTHTQLPTEKKNNNNNNSKRNKQTNKHIPVYSSLFTVHEKINN